MISDEERREVAERLRSASARRGDAPWMVEDLMLALGFRCYEDGDGQLFGRLADLIDRPIGVAYIPDAMEGNVFCPKCGAEIGEYGVPNYCHNCGMAITNGC